MTAKYVHDQNIKRFVELLQTEFDPEKRAVISRLLAEERARVLAPETPRPPQR